MLCSYLVSLDGTQSWSWLPERSLYCVSSDSPGRTPKAPPSSREQVDVHPEFTKELTVHIISSLNITPPNGSSHWVGQHSCLSHLRNMRAQQQHVKSFQARSPRKGLRTSEPAPHLASLCQLQCQPGLGPLLSLSGLDSWIQMDGT